MLGSIAGGLRRRSVIIGVAALAVSTSFVFISAGPSDAALAKCDGVPATINGTVGDDVIIGTSGDDVIAAKAGNDVIKGKGGNDTICGGDGKDEILGGSGADTIFGDAGADTIDGGKGADTIEGGKGGDWIEGGAGGDTLLGKGGGDSIDGGDGKDTLKGGGGADTLVGGAGTDTASGGSGTDACKAETETGCEENPIDFDLERFLINQAVPAADSDNPGAVDVVAKRAGVLRAFVGANRTGSGITPKVKLYWQDNGGDGKVTLSGPGAVKKNPKEAEIGDTFNYIFDNSFLKGSTKVYVEVDPGQKILEAKENNNRYPNSGWLDLDAVNLGSLNVEFIPMSVSNGPAPSVSKGQLFDFAERLFPVGNKDVNVGSGFNYDYDPNIAGPTFNPCTDNWLAALDTVTAIWVGDGLPERFYAAIADDNPAANPGGPGCGIGGIAWINQPGFLLQQASVSLEAPTFIFAHELGHNLGLNHAPCGPAAGVDPAYPYPGADIGTYGWDIDEQRLYAPGSYVDIMSYCNPYWISDYNYQKVVENRQFFGYYQIPLAADEVTMGFSGSVAGGSYGQSSFGHDHDSAKADPTTASARLVTAQEVDGLPRGVLAGSYQLVGVDASGGVVTAVAFGTHLAETNTGIIAGEGFAFSVKMKRSDVDRVVEWQVRGGARTLDSVAAN